MGEGNISRYFEDRGKGVSLLGFLIILLVNCATEVQKGNHKHKDSHLLRAGKYIYHVEGRDW
jgi:hypothetical protein